MERTSSLAGKTHGHFTRKGYHDYGSFVKSVYLYAGKLPRPSILYWGRVAIMSMLYDTCQSDLGARIASNRLVQRIERKY